MGFDTRSSDFWVVDATCTTKVCTGYLGIERVFNRQKFDTTKSSTLSRENIAIIVLYGSGWYDGALVKDTITFAGVTIQQQVFFSAEDMAAIFGYMRFDGIIGLAWPALSMNNEKMSHGGSNGLITFGAIDTVNCDSDIHYVPLSAEKYWEFTIEDFSLGSFSTRRANKAISDISTSWIGAPFFVVEEVVSQTGATYNTEYQFYSVDCSTMMTQPDLKFTINGVEYNVPSKQYVIDIEIGDGKCALALFEVDAGNAGYEWILGAPWIRTYCNIYDVGQKRVGFAKAKQQE
uniref:Peptidase A1 domain-containing protein n=1 Tax=Angiostrongylus cantonensis TaxID=6313 RepID=A0A0K0DNS9_ANGCA